VNQFINLQMDEQQAEEERETFPLLDFPNEIVVKILEYVREWHLWPFCVNKRIVSLFSREDKNPRTVAIITTEECSMITSSGRPLISSSMERVMERLDQLLSNANLSKLTLIFDRGNPFHKSLVSYAMSLTVPKLDISCTYENGQRHAALSNL
ncbi:hypothetical protein PFISCL1PPCAC_21474, partial [Pristionchus fissidentatus]